MNSWKILNRLLFLALTPAITVAILLTFYFSAAIISDLNRAAYERCDTLSDHLAATSANGVEATDLGVLHNLSRNALLTPGVTRVAIQDDAGNVLYETRGPQHEVEAPHPIIAMFSRVLFGQRLLSFQKEIHPPAARLEPHSGELVDPFQASSSRLGYVTVEYSSAGTAHQATQVVLKGTAIVAAILAVTALFVLHMGRTISRPIQNMLQTVTGIQKGQWEARLPLSCGGELGALERGIHVMAERLDSSREPLLRAVNAATTELNKKIKGIKQKNHELELARARAEDANLAKSRFLANMSHELRTPMNAIIGFSDLLKEYRVDDAHRDYVETIASSSADLLVLINEILDYSKIESGELKIEPCAFNFYELIGGVLNLLNKSAYEKDLELYVYMDPEIPVEISSDPLRLKQTVINLLSNAIRFTDQGHVALEVHRHRATDEAPGDYLEFRVIDTGIGIGGTDSAHIFEPFVQDDDPLAREHPGTGLGLAITKDFVAKLGGEIGFTSTPGKGSTFWFTLPLACGSQRLYHMDAPLGAMSALVYDRQPRRAGYTGDLLRAWGLTVTACDSIEAFSRAFETQQYGLILYYLHRNDVDTDLQISIKQLSRSPAVKLFLHNANHVEDLSPATGFLHLSNVITPYRLHQLIHEAIHRSADHEAGTSTPRYAGEDLSGLRVLIADDNEINQRLLQVYISRNNGEYAVAHNGREAIDLIDKVPLDAVIMDVHMPHVDGIAAMRMIKPRQPGLPIIAVTADASPEYISRYQDLGFDHCLTKPVSERDLIATILALSERRSRGYPAPAHTRAQATPGDTQELAVIDLDKAIKISGDNKGLAHELFNMLVVDLKSKRTQLTKEAAEDMDALAELAHKVRGGAKFCAAERVQRQAAKLEAAIRTRGDRHHIAQITDALIRAINELVALPNPYN
jgi:two-component system sensor histidine kinase BarA